MIKFECNKNEMLLQLIQTPKPKQLKHTKDLRIGDKVKRQFPYDIDGGYRSVIVEGEVINIIETLDSAYAYIQNKAGEKVVVCLG